MTASLPASTSARSNRRNPLRGARAAIVELLGSYSPAAPEPQRPARITGPGALEPPGEGDSLHRAPSRGLRGLDDLPCVGRADQCARPQVPEAAAPRVPVAELVEAIRGGPHWVQPGPRRTRPPRPGPCGAPRRAGRGQVARR